MPFAFRPLQDLPDVVVIEPKAFGDDRGWFMETYKQSDFAANGIRYAFSQDNHSRSAVKHVIRGLHYQKDPTAQGKLVRCILGAIYDVAVDIRRGSPTYGRWAAVEINAENKKLLWVPPGFAHGFCTLTDVSEVAYKTTAEYSAPDDRGILWNDAALGVKWPTTNPVLSAKDAHAPMLADADNNFTYKGRP